ncbi:MAG: hypothetical protein R3C53_19040 [Pirellulaceae bacterium]
MRNLDSENAFLSQGDAETLGIVNDEGLRTIRCPQGRATAAYHVAHLRDGRCILRMEAEYGCGNFSGQAIPWQIYANRDACIHSFLAMARKHFSHEHRCSVATPAQREAGLWMLEQLGDGLFGFLEPEPEPMER